MENSLQERYLPVLQKYWLVVLLGVLGVIFLISGLISLSFGSAQDKTDIVFESGHQSAPDSADSQTPQDKKITVDVEGAVVKPGVYSLPSDSRIQDALIAAGGMSDKADREKVSKGLNLASKLTDGGKIYIPFIGDSSHSASSGQALFGVGGGGDSVLGASSSLTNINTASASELDKLPGVGLVTAEKIISSRPYGSVEELVSKKVVSSKVFEQIKSKVSVY